MREISTEQMLARIAELEAQLVAAKKPKRNVRGGSGDVVRGSWVTRKEVADAVGSFFLDPFSNPRSHIVAERVCMLEDGGDGFGGGRKGAGAYKCGGKYPLYNAATDETRVWLQPDYSMVHRAFDHYKHTHWVALLKFDPRTTWFKRIFAMSEAVRVLWNAEFEPPPGVSGGMQSFPHALYFKSADDVTDEIKRITFGWKKQRKD